MLHKLLFLLVFVGGAQANVTAVGEIKCIEKTVLVGNSGETKDGRSCTYTIENLASVSELARKVEQALFDGEPLLEPEGILETFGNNNQTLIFSHQNVDVMDNMIEIIPLLDSKEDFSPSDVIQIQADVYEISETGLRNLGAGINSLKIGPSVNDGLSNLKEALLGTDGLGINIRTGMVDIAGFIALEKARGNMERIDEIKIDAYNLDKFEYNDLTNVYQAPGAGTSVKEAQAGIQIKGKVSINKSNRDTVVLKDFDFYYGTQNATGGVNQLRIPRKRLVLSQGVMFPIVSSKTTRTSNNTTTGILQYGNESVEENKKLLVYLTVRVLTWDEHVARMAKDKSIAVKSKFTKKERKALPKVCPSMEEVLGSIETHAGRGNDGEPILTFTLDKELACRKNVKKRIYVTTKINGNRPLQENTTILRIEELMLKPVQIKGVNASSFLKTWINFRVGLSIFGKPRSAIFTNLIFANTTEYVIDENFWVE